MQSLDCGDRSQAREGLKALLATAPAVQVAGEASDGKEAIDLVEKCRPDVVLMDAMMPVMNGLEATRRIKAEWPEVRVVVLTIHTALRAEALAAALTFFWSKDVRPASCWPQSWNARRERKWRLSCLSSKRVV